MPVDFRIRYDPNSLSDLRDLRALLGRAGDPPQEALQDGADAFAALMAEYPPPREGSEYIRTGDLGRGWRVTNDGSRFRVRNQTAYASLVQGAYRMWFHRETGWKTPREKWQERGDAVRSAMRRGVFRLWQKKRL